MRGYIKSSNFKTGAELGVYIYIGVTIASLCIAPFVFIFAPYLILPFALLVSKPVAWIALGAIFIVASGLTFSTIKPLLDAAKDSLKRRKIQKKGFVGLETLDSKSFKVPTKSSLSSSKISLDTQNSTSSLSGLSSFSSEVDPEQYDATYGQQDLVNQTQAGNYNYLLQYADVGALARIVQGLEPQAHEIVGSTDQITKQLNSFKKNIEKNEGSKRLIFIVNIHNGHWVTLAVNHDGKQFNAYYYDSLNGKKFRSTFTKILKRELGMNESNIRFFNEKIQDDGSNCGIFALEAASRINQMLDKGISFDDMDTVLLEFKPKAKELRNQLAEILSADEERSEFTVTDVSKSTNSHVCPNNVSLCHIV
ncbi:Ulp1 protease family, C-terminal catalytic domain [Cinara cedri]|uniref:Ulp1 protease family, C-terminal catalytic domain n=1 Tax=Cinara cedri TaxID=506608 RepID=A0A5E4M7K8_9HEMI|nr:Ulp1 protease family, C-terminal catalytic domain [Cinara cedri]